MVVTVLVAPGACGLVDRDLHSIGSCYPRIVISPGHRFREREQLRARLLEYPGHGLGILNRKRQTDRATHAPAHFHLVNKVGLRGISFSSYT